MIRPPSFFLSRPMYSSHTSRGIDGGSTGRWKRSSNEIRRCQAIAAAGTSADAQLAVYAAHRKDKDRDHALRAVTDWIASATLQ